MIEVKNLTKRYDDVTALKGIDLSVADGTVLGLIGTNGGGIAHTVGQDSKGNWLFESFGAKDGLPSE
jgi:ABC-type enterochelin transport system ATPase subunit